MLIYAKHRRMTKMTGDRHTNSLPGTKYNELVFYSLLYPVLLLRIEVVDYLVVLESLPTTTD
jgi:hypothetical protein